MRRHLLIGLLLAVPALSAPAADARLSARDFEQTPAAGLARAASAGEWRSAVVRAPGRFDLVGLRWSTGGEVEAHIRVRRRDGWTPWTEMAHAHGARPGAEPVWAGDADAYQVRLDRRVRGLRAHFVDVRGRAPAVARRAQAPGGGPAIVPRAAWGADQCKPRSAPSYGTVNAGVVHHTVSTTSYTPDQSASMVLAICRFHRNSNGWSDVGYNFLVDRYGKIFEGRAGGVAQPVIGAQAQGYNSTTTGIANLGDFSTAGQTPEALAANADLLAWKLSLHGAPVAGPVTIPSQGGASNRFPTGFPVKFERIAGHRDGDKTACPGDALFAQLPEIRRLAAARAPLYARPASGGMELGAPRRVLYPADAALSGRLTGPDGAPLIGTAVSVQIRSGSRWVGVARATTGADGRWSAVVRSSRSRQVRAVAAGPAGQVISLARNLAVAPTVEAKVSTKRVRVGRSIVVSGRTRPRGARVRVEVARRTSTGRYQVVARISVRSRAGRFRHVVRPRRAALTRVRVLTVASASNAAGRSEAHYVRVVR